VRGIHLNYRQKGLLWFSTYKVDSTALTRFRTSSREKNLCFDCISGAAAVYDNVQLARTTSSALTLAVTGGGANAADAWRESVLKRLSLTGARQLEIHFRRARMRTAAEGISQARDFTCW